MTTNTARKPVAPKDPIIRERFPLEQEYELGFGGHGKKAARLKKCYLLHKGRRVSRRLSEKDIAFLQGGERDQLLRHVLWLTRRLKATVEVLADGRHCLALLPDGAYLFDGLMPLAGPLPESPDTHKSVVHRLQAAEQEDMPVLVGAIIAEYGPQKAGN